MSKTFDSRRLRLFLDEAIPANVSYYATRRRLYGLFVGSLDRNGDIRVPTPEYMTIRTFLSSRINNPTSEARLAYEIAVDHIDDLVGDRPPVHGGVDDEED